MLSDNRRESFPSHDAHQLSTVLGSQKITQETLSLVAVASGRWGVLPNLFPVAGCRPDRMCRVMFCQTVMKRSSRFLGGAVAWDREPINPLLEAESRLRRSCAKPIAQGRCDPAAFSPKTGPWLNKTSRGGQTAPECQRPVLESGPMPLSETGTKR